jgi:outer membrane protein OmpU
MKNWKKAGLTALAGSLVALSAQAGEMSVTGSANITYTANTGAQDSDPTAASTALGKGSEGSRWGMNRTISASGSGEMDNGWTVTVSQSLANGGLTANSITLDMGDAGSLNYETSTSARGIGKIADMLPTADEDAGNGLDADGTGTGSGVSGKVSGGVKGFHYSKAMDMVEIGIGYAPKGGQNNGAGGTSGAGAGMSSTSVFVKVDPMDGLEIGGGWGETANAASVEQANDHSTYYASYVWGSITVAAQQSEVDYYNSANDDESTAFGILYAVNDEMSISYQDRENDQANNTIDEEITGWSASYTMGSMTFKAHSNEGKNMDNTASKTSEHTEIGVSFAF